MQPKIAICRILFSTSNCQCSLFSKKNPVIRIFYISGWHAVPINPDKWSYTVLISTTHWVFPDSNQNNMRFWVSRVAKCRPILTLPDDDCRDFPLRVTHLLISFRFHRHTVTETISATSASPIIPITRLFRGGGISS